MKKQIQVISILLITLLLSNMFAGCKDKPLSVNSNEKESYKQPGVISYPIKTDATLTYWMPNYGTFGKYTQRSQFPFYEELTKRTGINVQWIYPTRGQEKQQFSILLASGELPDIIEYEWSEFPGGSRKALSDDYITKLNDLMDKYSPNIKKYYSEHPEQDKAAKTDAGEYSIYPSMQDTSEGAEKMLTTAGYMMRKDWLDDLGLEVPTTIDEWYNVLKAFKSRKGAESPLALISYEAGYGLSGAFGVNFGFYQDNGVVKYGRMQPTYKDFLTEIIKWYKEGLLDKDTATLDKKMVDAKLLSGKTGAVAGWLGSGMGTWINTAKKTDPKFDLVGVPFPTLKKGDVPKFSTRVLPIGTFGAAISAGSKNKELAARFLDYAYSEEGHMLYNFGVENISYKMENDYPKYTDQILKNTDGLSIAEAMTLYIRGNALAPSWTDKRYIEQYYQLPQQKAAQETWSKTDAAQYMLPLVSLTNEESAQFAKINSDVNTYADEMYLKFILGAEPIENYEKYVGQMKQLGVDKLVQIMQNAMDRYNKR